MRRSLAAVAVVALVALSALSATPARAAVLWTVTASPLAVSTGVPTTFTLRASLTLLGEIRCLTVDVPGNFAVASADVVGSNAGDGWVADVSGNQVRVLTTSGGDRLRSIGDHVDFSIRATALSAGSLAWPSNAYDDTDGGECAGSRSLLSVPPIVLVTGPAVAPTPAPTASPAPTPSTPKPTATPRATPTPLIPLPPLPSLLPLPTLQPLPTLLPLPTLQPQSTPISTPRATSGESDDPDPDSTLPDGRASAPSAQPAPSDATAALEPRVSPSSPTESPGAPARAATSAGGGSTISIAPITGEPASLELGMGDLGMLSGVGVWAVPAATIGIPGLLILAWVALQAAGALAWIPAVRRLRGDDERDAIVRM